MLDPAPGVRSWLRPGGVYLVTGGLGGIGLEVMEHLARHAKARLVSVGRSPMPQESAWDRWLEEHGEQDDTSRRIGKVRALRALGAEVMLATADVTDREAMTHVVAEASSTLWPDQRCLPLRRRAQGSVDRTSRSRD